MQVRFDVLNNQHDTIKAKQGQKSKSPKKKNKMNLHQPMTCRFAAGKNLFQFCHEMWKCSFKLGKSTCRENWQGLPSLLVGYGEYNVIQQSHCALNK